MIFSPFVQNPRTIKTPCYAGSSRQGRCKPIFGALGISTGQLFVLLFLGLGPIRICLSWMSIAQDLNHQEQRNVALSITQVGAVLFAVIMLIGFLTVRNITPLREWPVIGASIVLIVSSFVRRTPEPLITDEPSLNRAMRTAIHPLAVPTMINPAGSGLLLIDTTFEGDSGW